jgi:hypothetical protein
MAKKNNSSKSKRSKATSRKNSSVRKNLSKKYEFLLVLGIVCILVLIIWLISYMNGLFTFKSSNGVVGQAFSYTGCEKLPCKIEKVPVDHYYGFTYKDVLYKFRIKELDAVNKKIKYEITTMETDDKENLPDLVVDEMEVTKVQDPYIYLDITVKNIGDKNVYDAFKVRVQTLDEDDDVWKSAYADVEGLNQDEDYTVEMSVKYNPSYYEDHDKIPFVVTVDSSDEINEVEEDNNEDDDIYVK